MANVPDVDDVIPGVLQHLQLGMEGGPGGVVVAVLRQLGQVNLPVVSLGHDVARLVSTQSVADETNEQDDNDGGGGNTGRQGNEGRCHELLDDGGLLLYDLHLHLVVTTGHILHWNEEKITFLIK